MAPQDGSRLRESLGRKLTKRKPNPRRVSLEVPERFRDDSDDETDVCAPRSGALAMNQSIFSLIAAAGSSAALGGARSDSEEEDQDHRKSSLSQTVPTLAPSTAAGGITGAAPVPTKHRRRSSKALLVKSLHKLRLRPIRERKNSSADDMMSSSQILAPRRQEPEPEDDMDDDATLSNAPELSRILTAEAKMRQELRAGADKDEGRPVTALKKPLSFAREVQKMFKFEEMEEIIAEYRCSLVQNLDILGHLFLTKRHICFYAYLPQMSVKVAAKSGYIAKRGLHDPRYHRYYCELKGHVLNFYEDAAQINYPRSLIDMRRSIGVCLAGKEKGKDETHFTLTTDKRDYDLRADSKESASEWVHLLQQEILNNHNDGKLLKISLPIENILDVEDNYIRGMGFSETLRIRVIDNDETYAVDEYYFTFGTNGQEAIRVLKIMVENFNDPTDSEMSGSEASSSARQSLTIERPSAVPARTPPLRESVRSTLAPVSPGNRAPSSSRLSSDSRRSSLDVRRPSMDDRRRSYDDGSRRSVSDSLYRERSPMSPLRQDSTGPPPTSPSIDPDTESSATIQSMDETATDASESQILNRSDVFQVPTIHAPSPQRSKTDGEVVDRLLNRASQDTARSNRRSTQSPTRKGSVKDQRPRPLSRISTSGLSLSEQDSHRMQTSNFSLQHLVKAASSPLQSASGIAGYLGKKSSQMSSLVASDAMGYYEKVAGMWAGGARHYVSSEGIRPYDTVPDANDEMRDANDAQRFRDHFAMPESEQLLASWHCHAQRTLPVYGKLYLGSTHLCWRPLMARTTKMKLPLKVIETVIKGTSYRLGYSGMCIVVSGDEEVFFDFKDSGLRDDCVVTILLALQSVEPTGNLAESGILSEDEIKANELAKAEHRALQDARRAERTVGEDEEHDFLAESMMFDDPAVSILNFKPTEPLRVTCLTIGSRGDVQPYIALCKGLLKEGHKPKIATHVEFGDWIKSHGIDFEPIEGDPAVLMQLCVENGMFTFSFMKEAALHFRSWIDGLMDSAWKACQNSDVIIESPSAMVGIHISEALQVPYFRAFGMPWTRTRAFPHAFFVPNKKSGGTYNYMTYTLFDTLFWKSTAGQINAWRKSQLNLKPTSLSRMQINNVPFLYNFSKFVVRQPLDWSEWVRITGYWFLDEEQDWTPNPELVAFIKKARDDGKKLVYIGFGSITVDNPAALTDTVVRAVMDNDLRCVLSKGWSDRLVKAPKFTAPEVPLPPEILQVKYSVPHSWLFPQMDAITHHGGAGTTGASLRAGKPTIIKPFFGDQYFFGSRVEDLGVGIYVRIMNEKKFGRALYYATHDERMRKKASWVGEQIRSEDGVATAIQALYRDLEYSRSLVKRKAKKEATEVDVEDEQWQFVEEDGEGLQDAVLRWDGKEQGLVVGHEDMGLRRDKGKGKAKVEE